MECYINCDVARIDLFSYINRESSDLLKRGQTVQKIFVGLVLFREKGTQLPKNSFLISFYLSHLDIVQVLGVERVQSTIF